MKRGRDKRASDKAKIRTAQRADNKRTTAYMLGEISVRDWDFRSAITARDMAKRLKMKRFYFKCA